MNLFVLVDWSHIRTADKLLSVFCKQKQYFQKPVILKISFRKNSKYLFNTTQKAGSSLLDHSASLLLLHVQLRHRLEIVLANEGKTGYIGNTHSTAILYLVNPFKSIDWVYFTMALPSKLQQPQEVELN